jgi:hypothetical protein
MQFQVLEIGLRLCDQDLHFLYGSRFVIPNYRYQTPYRDPLHSLLELEKIVYIDLLKLLLFRPCPYGDNELIHLNVDDACVSDPIFQFRTGLRVVTRVTTAIADEIVIFVQYTIVKDAVVC